MAWAPNSLRIPTRRGARLCYRAAPAPGPMRSAAAPYKGGVYPGLDRSVSAVSSVWRATAVGARGWGGHDIRLPRPWAEGRAYGSVPRQQHRGVCAGRGPPSGADECEAPGRGGALGAATGVGWGVTGGASGKAQSPRPGSWGSSPHGACRAAHTTLEGSYDYPRPGRRERQTPPLTGLHL